MKNIKKYFGIVVLMSVTLLCFCGGSATKVNNSSGIPLDRAVKEAAARIDERVEPGSKIAILNFNSPSSSFDEYVIAELEASLLDIGKLTIIDRKEIDLIRGELKFQRTGEVDDESIQKLGRVLGAQTIVSGSLTDIGGIHRIVIRVLKVESAAVVAQYRSDIIEDSRVKALLAGGKKSGGKSASAYAEVSGGGSKQTVPQTAQQTAPAYSDGGSGDTNNSGQTAQARQQTGMKNGTYTLWPRPQAAQAGLPINFYFAKIVATNDYIVFFFARNAQGEINGHSGFWEGNHFTLQDLDNPSKFYKPAQADHDSNGMGAIRTMSFKRFPATRFQITTGGGGWPYGSEPIVWEEIIIGEPDK
ncbi:MAG: penicillin-binding protein activator LpoB [Chitinispirillales bacterium]|nr:penicillin-binding protein activator LpoB [Chitinispirillales bacterium]